MKTVFIVSPRVLLGFIPVFRLKWFWIRLVEFCSPGEFRSVVTEEFPIVGRRQASDDLEHPCNTFSGFDWGGWTALVSLDPSGTIGNGHDSLGNEFHAQVLGECIESRPRGAGGVVRPRSVVRRGGKIRGNVDNEAFPGSNRSGWFLCSFFQLIKQGLYRQNDTLWINWNSLSNAEVKLREKLTLTKRKLPTVLISK